MEKVINIGGRLHNPVVGGAVTGADEIKDDTKGKMQSVINQETDAEMVRLDGAKQDKLTFDQTPTENSTNPVTSGGVYAADAALQQAIEAILLLIPSAASALNQLADKSFVNSSIATSTATFRGTYNVVADLGLTIDATHQQIAEALGAAISTADNNDYCYVQVPIDSESSDIRRTERYKFNGTAWSYEYDLNTSGYTASQWAAINSGITAALVGDLNDIKSYIPAEATALNKLADMAYVLAQIIANIPAFKGQFTTLSDLQAVQSPKAGDCGIVRTKDNDGQDVFTFYQYLNGSWNVYYVLSRHPQRKPVSTGVNGDYPFNGMGLIELPMNMREGWMNDTWVYYPVNGIVYLLYSWNFQLYAVYSNGEGLGLENNVVVKPANYNISDIADIVANRYLPFTEDGGVYTITKPNSSTITSTDLNNTTIVNYNDPSYKGVNVLTQDMMSAANTKYVIKYDYELAEDITVPANCILEFDGGSIDGGGTAGLGDGYTVTFDNTIVTKQKNAFTNCRFAGSLATQQVFISTFGVIADGQHDDSLIINDILNCVNEKGCEIIFDCDGDYGIGNSNLHSKIEIKSDTTLTFTGKGFFKLLSYSNGGQVVLILNSKNVVINNIQIDGGGSSVIVGAGGQNGIGCGNSQNIQINGGYIKNCYKGLDTEIDGNIIYGEGGKGIQVENHNVDNFIAKGVFIENCFRALSSRRDFQNKGPIICQFLGIRAKDCEQFASVTQVNGEDVTGKEHRIIISNFIIENCGSYDGLFIFGRARNTQILNGTITGNTSTSSIFRGRFSYSKINNILILQPCGSIIDLTPSVYGNEEGKAQYNDIDVTILSEYTSIAKTNTGYAYKALLYSNIKIFSKNIPTYFTEDSPFSSGHVYIDMNFGGDNRFIGTTTQFYYICNNSIANIKGTIFGDWPRRGTSQVREELKSDMQQGTTYFDTNFRRLVVRNSGGFVDTDGNEAVAAFGTSTNRPVAPSTASGAVCYEEDTKRKILWNGRQWCDLDGTSLDKVVPQSSQRPTSALRVGFMCFDIQLGKPIFVKSIDNSTTPATVVWVDATGTAV